MTIPTMFTSQFPKLTAGEGVALGLVVGTSPVYKLGYNSSISGANQEDLWNVGGAYTFPAAASGYEVVSSDNTNDKANGTGALTVKIFYLTTGFVEKSEIVTMTGTAAAATVAVDIYRINSFRIGTAGSSGVAAGNILLRVVSAGATKSRIDAGQTRARNMAYTVPVGKKLVIQSFECSSSGTVGTSYLKFTLRATQDDLTGAASSIEFPFFEVAVQTTGLWVAMPQPIVFEAGVDTHVVVIGDSATSAAAATAAWRGFLMDA